MSKDRACQKAEEENATSLHDRNQHTLRTEDEAQSPNPRIKRHASLYDAVAGRIGHNGFLSEISRGPDNKSHLTRSKLKSLSPEQVLLRSSAPSRYSERKDFYSADQDLPPNIRLPDSDLLKAIHAYVSDFYSMTTHDHGRCDFWSMNETSLLAMGILLEEAAAEVLGENGDMALVEPEVLDNGIPEDSMTTDQIQGSVRPVATPELEAESESDEELFVSADESSGRGRRRKRMRYINDTTATAMEFEPSM